MYKTLLLFLLLAFTSSAKINFENIIPGYSDLSLEDKINHLINFKITDSNLHDSEILEVYTEAADLAEELGDREFLISATLKLAQYQFGRRKYSAALFRYKRLLNLYDQDQYSERGNAELKIGECFKFTGLYEKSVQHFINALNIADANNLKYLKSSVLVNLGHVNLIWGNYDRSLENFSEALHIKEGLNEPRNIAHVLKNMGNVYVRMQKYEEAEKQYSRALELFEQEGDSAGIAAVLNNFGFSEEAQSNYSNALLFYEKSKIMASAINDDFLLQHNFYNIANIYFKMGRYKDAENLVIGNLILSSNNNNLEIYLKNKLLLAKLAIAENRFKDAIKLYDEYIVQKDSIINIETSEKISSMMIAYENEGLQKKISVLEDETKTLSRNLWIVIFISVFIIGLMITSKYIKKPGS